MSPETVANPNEKIEKAIRLVPTEFRCIDELVDGTSLTEDDLLLKELGIKVENSLHARLGHGMPADAEMATPEEVQKFRDILDKKVKQYSEYSNLLGDISL